MRTHFPSLRSGLRAGAADEAFFAILVSVGVLALAAGIVTAHHYTFRYEEGDITLVPGYENFISYK